MANPAARLAQMSDDEEEDNENIIIHDQILTQQDIPAEPRGSKRPRQVVHLSDNEGDDEVNSCFQLPHGYNRFEWGHPSRPLLQGVDGEEYPYRGAWKPASVWENFVPGIFRDRICTPQDLEFISSIPSGEFKVGVQELQCWLLRGASMMGYLAQQGDKIANAEKNQKAAEKARQEALQAQLQLGNKESALDKLKGEKDELSILLESADKKIKDLSNDLSLARGRAESSEKELKLLKAENDRLKAIPSEDLSTLKNDYRQLKIDYKRGVRESFVNAVHQLQFLNNGSIVTRGASERHAIENGQLVKYDRAGNPSPVDLQDPNLKDYGAPASSSAQTGLHGGASGVTPS